MNSLQAIESRQMEREEAKRKKPQEGFYIPLDGHGIVNRDNGRARC